ncbi:MAG: L-lactate permease [Terriglobales bacterium]
MIAAAAPLWRQPIHPFGPLLGSALAAALPIVVVLWLMAARRKAAHVAAAWGLLAALVLALAGWHMPAGLALASCLYGAVYALWPIMWIVLAALWLYNLTVELGLFEQMRRWIVAHAGGDRCVQAILVAFCFGALLEGTAGFGAPVAIAGFLLLTLGFSAMEAVVLSLIANTAPVAFGALGIPIVALAGVTGLNLRALSSAVGRQIPFLSLFLPAYLAAVYAGWRGLRRIWPVAAVAGISFAGIQFVVANYWGPYAPDVLASLGSIAAVVLFLRVWTPSGAQPELAVAAAVAPAEQVNVGISTHSLSREQPQRGSRQLVEAWAPWLLLAAAMVIWTVFKLFGRGALRILVPHLDGRVFITLYGHAYAAVYTFQPLAAGTAALAAVLATAILFRAPLRVLWTSAVQTCRQLRQPTLTVCLIIALADLYNYSGMTYTMGAALAKLGVLFPLVSAFLGWVACFLSGSDTSSNVLFGNLQVAAAHRIGINPVLTAATNSTGAVTGKMISPQNIAVGVTTVGLTGQEGAILRRTLWHSLIFAAAIGLLAFAQAHWLRWMIPVSK